MSTITNNTNTTNNTNNIIPNVSCVFRDLVQLSHTTHPRFNSSEQQPRGYINTSYNNTNMIYNNNNNNHRHFDYNSTNKERVDLISNMGVDDRQQRHDQLMNRFKHSLQENRQLLGINSTSQQYQYQYERANQYQSRNNNEQQYSMTQPYYNNPTQPRQVTKKWSIPQIKYRHIEDFQEKKSDTKKNNNTSQQIMHEQQAIDYVKQSQTAQSKLQRQFYQNNIADGRKTSNISPTQLTTSSNNLQNLVDNNKIEQQSQLANKYSRFSNNQQQKQSKYNENLQSYYELCRKPFKPALIVQKKDSIKQTIKPNQQKFLRKPQTKTGGINLSKAIQILNLD